MIIWWWTYTSICYLCTAESLFHSLGFLGRPHFPAAPERIPAGLCWQRPAEASRHEMSSCWPFLVELNTTEAFRLNGILASLCGRVQVWSYLKAAFADRSPVQTKQLGGLPASLVYSAASAWFLDTWPRLSLCWCYLHGWPGTEAPPPCGEEELQLPSDQLETHPWFNHLPKTF